ncbi:MAG: hypothetical protein DRQ55_13125 [Planctomycetota bacterium]|nr:MAG: hypothetical protein DRQ55_13125 [Planctomycetota bacterium]
MRRAALLLISLLTPLASAPAQDTRSLADGLVRLIRAHEQADGGYGELARSCRVLDLLGRSPRRYNELDGPFVRRAAELVANDTSPELDAWRVLALAGAVTPPMVAARNRARDRLAADAAGLLDARALLALYTLPPAVSPRLPEAPAGASAELAVLLASDPASVAPPAVDAGADWTRWARAARLRGLRPGVLPSLPQAPASADTPLPELLERLELVIVLHGLLQPSGAVAELPPLPAKKSAPDSLEAALAHALVFLESRQSGGTLGLDAPGWDGPEPGVTALCLSGAIRASDMLGRPAPKWVDPGLDWLASLQRPDGSIQTYGVAVYTTSVAMEALLDGGRERHAVVVARALTFLVAAQADEGEGYRSEDDPHYGGVGYGGDERPDLSNTFMALGAAQRAGLDPDDAFFQKALTFLRRNQNLGEAGGAHLPRAGGGTTVPGTDGGATYMPGNSPAGEDQVGDGIYVARSYGSMTYALTRSYLICGLTSQDQRVAAAVVWLARNFSVRSNPGFDDPARAGDGLYYYYMAMARTLRLVDDELLIREDGSTLDWRTELLPHLLGQQRIDGSWANEHSSRWYEGSPTLCTGFALLTLAASDS